VIDIGGSTKFVADVHIHARLDSGEGPVKLLLHGDSTPASTGHKNFGPDFCQNLRDQQLACAWGTFIREIG
jgi:hypothetical protein